MSMTRRAWSAMVLVVVGVAAMAAGGRAATAETRPNIVVLFADDLGYGDLSSYGCPDIKTPAIDGIAQRGVRFTRFYTNSPECTPSRTALLTGRYQQRVGGLECAIGVGNVGRYDEAVWLQQRGELGLPASEPTIASRLRSAGYDTAIIGKWHLGYEPKFWPDRHGFQESFVALGGGTDYVTHTEQSGEGTLVHNGKRTTTKGYLTDVFADRAIQWIAERGRAPFFLYVPFNAPHDPFQASGDGPATVPWGAGTRDTYRRMVEHMDKRIGDILAAIAKSPAADNTIVVFLSDNGAPRIGRNAPWRGFKGELWEGGIRVPCVLSWPKRIPAGRETNQVALNMDLAATLLTAAGVRADVTRPLDGVDLIEVLAGRKDVFSRTIFWRYKRLENRRKAMLEGDLKLVIDNGREELLDLAQDPGETRNLVAARSEKVREMRARIEAWEREVAAPRLREFRPPEAPAASAGGPGGGPVPGKEKKG